MRMNICFRAAQRLITKWLDCLLHARRLLLLLLFPQNGPRQTLRRRFFAIFSFSLWCVCELWA
jgi:hypothetical protein